MTMTYEAAGSFLDAVLTVMDGYIHHLSASDIVKCAQTKPRVYSQAVHNDTVYISYSLHMSIAERCI